MGLLKADRAIWSYGVLTFYMSDGLRFLFLWTAYRSAVNKTFVDIEESAYQTTLDNHYNILLAVEARDMSACLKN